MVFRDHYIRGQEREDESYELKVLEKISPIDDS
jgi:hypothetical protein